MQPTIVLARRADGATIGPLGGLSIDGGFGGLNFSWCRLGCDTAYALCTAGCSGISAGAGVAACVVLCSALYQECSAGC